MFVVLSLHLIPVYGFLCLYQSLLAQSAIEWGKTSSSTTASLVLPPLYDCLGRGGGFGLCVFSGFPQGLCVVGVLRLGPWGPVVSQKLAEGVGQNPLPKGGSLPPPCLRCHDFADLFHYPG